MLVVDYPPEKPMTSRRCCKARAWHRSSLWRRRPRQNVLRMSRLARGYVYYVSLRGVTGAGHLDVDEVAGKVAAIKAAVPVPRRCRFRHP